jgi:RNA recognition motif-containing protein
MGTTLFVDNLSSATRAQDLHDLFSRNGRHVRNVSLVTDPESGQSRGFGFVEMAAGTEMAAVLEALNGTEFLGRLLSLSEVTERGGTPQRSGRPLGDFGARW